MYTEIEAKLKVDSHKEIVDKLPALGAEFIGERTQKDSYFDDKKSTLTKSDRGLRLRRQLIGGSERVFLTYKGPREKNAFKKRTEVEIEITDGNSLETFLLALGYEKVLVFEKKRLLWKLGDCEVALDDLLLLGTFVEIEGPDDERIAAVQKSLGLSHLPHVKESYATLMAAKLGRSGKDNKS